MLQLRKHLTPHSLTWALSLLQATITTVLALPNLTSECPIGFKGRLDSPGYTQCAIPVDDTSTTWAPWTHPPYCIDSAKTASSPARFCVYTNIHLGPFGLSIIATPEHAASSLSLLEDPNPHLHRLPTTTPPPWAVVDIQGKGRGVVATRRIARYEPFMVERAVVATDIRFPSVVPRRDGYELLREAVDRLRDPDAVLSLAQSSAYAGHVVEDVLRTNSFAGELDGVPHMALFPVIARMNHACKPNAFTRYSRRSMTTAVMAAKDIEIGEEITISYATLGLHFQERQDRLQKTWGFKCACDLCSQSETQRAVSDQRRKDIQEKRQGVVAAVDAADAARAIRLCNEILDLLASEDLPSMFAEQYEVLARVYQAVGYKEKAAKYARMAMKVLEIYGAMEEDDEYDALGSLLQSIEEGGVGDEKNSGGESRTK